MYIIMYIIKYTIVVCVCMVEVCLRALLVCYYRGGVCDSMYTV